MLTTETAKPTRLGGKMPANGETRKEIPGRSWFLVGTRMVRIAENTIGGHIVVIKLAPRRVQKRLDKPNIDERPSGGV